MGQLSGRQEEFKALIHRAGWSAADAARALKLTPASISRYLNGLAEPPERTLDYLYRLVIDKADAEDENIVRESQPAIHPILQRVARLPEVQQSVILRVIEALLGPERKAEITYQDVPPKDEVSSSVDDVAKRMLEHGAAEVLRERPIRLPSPATGAPSARISKPGAGKPGHLKNQPGLPKEAPIEPKAGEE